MMRCYLIATGQKHYESDRSARDAIPYDVSAQSSLRGAGLESFEFLDKTTRQEVEPPAPVVDDMVAVIKFWADFLKRNSLN